MLLIVITLKNFPAQNEIEFHLSTMWLHRWDPAHFSNLSSYHPPLPSHSSCLVIFPSCPEYPSLIPAFA